MGEELRIAISAGEPSGDEHAAELVEALLKREPALTFRGMGGRNMRAAGVDTVVDSEESASVMGFVEVVGSLGKILGALRDLVRLFDEWRPDLLIVVDYPDFNIQLARRAKRRGIPIIYYIPPQLWAWRTGRAKQIGKLVEACGVIFPFEPKFYSERGFDGAHFVGHPFVDHPADIDRAGVRSQIWNEARLDPERPTLAILPGSRPKEVVRHLIPMLAAYRVLRERRPEVQAVIPVAPAIRREDLQEHIHPEDQVGLINGRSSELLQCANAGLLKSGTSNLQGAFAGLPFCMFYVAPLVSEIIVRMFVKLREFSIVNVIRSETVKEFLQNQAGADTVADELEALLFNAAYADSVRTKLSEVTKTLQTPSDLEIFVGCSTSAERAAALALSVLNRL